MTTTDPKRSVEVERTYDAPPHAQVPDFSGVPGVTSISHGHTFALDAEYFDTDTTTLGRAGVAVRRRRGGTDEGWHMKGPRREDSREELRWPLGNGDPFPAGLIPALAEWTSDPLEPLARIRNHRTIRRLHGPDGHVRSAIVAEFMDDEVTATDLRSGTVREWREWEVELGDAAPASDAGRQRFFDAVEAAVRAAGGFPAPTESKLARALGV